MKKKLENFIINNPDLEKLEDLLSQFNFFEILGLERNEIRHSNMLAFLLSPSESHGLSDYFLKKFLMSATSNESVDFLSPVDIDGWILTDSIIQREHRHIDILITSKRNKFVCCIENKIDSGEHDDQLQRYEDCVNREFSTFKKLFIFLSPDGQEPSKGHENWIVMTYDQIKGVLDNVIEFRGENFGDSQRFLIKQYSEIIGRQFVSDSKEIELAKKIYSTHKAALEFIFKHRPKPSDDIKKLIEENGNLILLYSTDSYIRFTTKTIDKLLPKVGGKKGVWEKIQNVFVYEIQVKKDFIYLKLILGPAKNSDYRKRIYEAIKEKPCEFFNLKKEKPLTNEFYSLSSWTLVTDANCLSSEDLKEQIKEQLEMLNEQDICEIDHYFENNISMFTE